MRVLSQKDYKLLEQIVSMKQHSLKKIIASYLQKIYGNTVVETEQYLYAEGDIPIALVAHLDTVFKTSVQEVFYDTKKGVMWSPQGLGADDRAGVFAILKILQSGLRPHVIFTTDEEIGGVGAGALSEKPCPFKDLRFIIELDRRGSNDCIFYDCDNKEFIAYIESFGFVENFGSFSDICFICPSWGISGVNLSIGYRDEHSYTEVLFVNSMLLTIERVKQILQQPKEDIPYFKWIESPQAFFWNDTLHHTYNTNLTYICGECGKEYKENDIIVARTLDGKDYKIYCKSCAAGKVEECIMCGEYFEISPDDPLAKICPDCYKEVMEEYERA